MTHPTEVARPAAGRRATASPRADQGWWSSGQPRVSSTTCWSSRSSRASRALGRPSAAGCSPGRTRRPGPLSGRTVVVTGPTSGLGREAAYRLAELGARVVLVGRDPQSSRRLATTCVASTARTASRPSSPTCHRWRRSTTPSHGSGADEPRIDVLIDNAGAMTPDPNHDPDGLETTFATMVVGPFALIAGLLPTLRATPGSRVIAVTSGGQYAQALDLDDLQWTARPFDGTRAYAQAKRAQVCLVREWARRLPRGEVTFIAMHPGWADTPGLEASLPGFRRLMRPLLRTPREGADTTVWLAAASSCGDPGRSAVSRPASPPVRPCPLDTRRCRRPSPAVGHGRRPRRHRGPAVRCREVRMTRLHETVETALPIEPAFAFIADFANNPAWDPGTAAARRLDSGPVGVGSTLRAGRPDGRPDHAHDLPDHRARAGPARRVARRRLVGAGRRRHPVRADRRRRHAHRLHGRHRADRLDAAR